MMARPILAYTKEILEKVSFDVSLFTRELKKALEMLLPDEKEELRFYVNELVEFNPSLEPSLAFFT